MIYLSKYKSEVINVLSNKYMISAIFTFFYSGDITYPFLYRLMSFGVSENVGNFLNNNEHRKLILDGNNIVNDLSEIEFNSIYGKEFLITEEQKLVFEFERILNKEYYEKYFTNPEKYLKLNEYDNNKTLKLFFKLLKIKNDEKEYYISIPVFNISEIELFMKNEEYIDFELELDTLIRNYLIFLKRLQNEFEEPLVVKKINEKIEKMRDVLSDDYPELLI